MRRVKYYVLGSVFSVLAIRLLNYLMYEFDWNLVLKFVKEFF